MYLPLLRTSTTWSPLRYLRLVLRSLFFFVFDNRDVLPFLRRSSLDRLRGRNRGFLGLHGRLLVWGGDHFALKCTRVEENKHFGGHSFQYVHNASNLRWGRRCTLWGDIRSGAKKTHNHNSTYCNPRSIPSGLLILTLILVDKRGSLLNTLTVECHIRIRTEGRSGHFLCTETHKKRSHLSQVSIQKNCVHGFSISSKFMDVPMLIPSFMLCLGLGSSALCVSVTFKVTTHTKYLSLVSFNPDHHFICETHFHFILVLEMCFLFFTPSFQTLIDDCCPNSKIFASLRITLSGIQVISSISMISDRTKKQKSWGCSLYICSFKIFSSVLVKNQSIWNTKEVRFNLWRHSWKRFLCREIISIIACHLCTQVYWSIPFVRR